MKSKKGSKFEREISGVLSRWWTGGIRDDIFWRTPGSGARATTRMKKKLQTADSAGDIMAIDKIGKKFTKFFLIELKRGYSSKLTILDIIDGPKKKSIILEWWKKAEKERVDSKRKDIILIFKRDRKDPCVAITKKLFNILFKADKIDHIEILKKPYNIYIITLSNFLKVIPKKLLETKYKRVRRRI